MFFVSVDSKGFSDSVSSLDATLTRYFISVDSKWFREVGEWESGTRKLRGRAGQEATIVGGREKPFGAPFEAQGKQGKQAEILIGTSRLSMNKHEGE